MIPSFTTTWDGEAFAPLPRFAKLCDAEFEVGEYYVLAIHEQRSTATHNHYFASLHDAWLNLPDEQAERFPTSEHLRKYSLIRCGYADSRQIAAASKAEAQRLAAFVRPMDEYALVAVKGAVVTVYTAKSQSKKAMGAKEFQQSKQDVLDYVASLIGTTADELARNARQVA